MSDQENRTPTEEAVTDLDEAIQEEAEAVEEVTEDVVEDVAEQVADAAETATEAAAEAAQNIEETVAEAVEGHDSLSDGHVDEVYNRVMHRLQEEGHIPSPAIAEEVAGEAEHAVEVADEAPEVVVEEAPVPVTRDRIRPTSEHFWYRPRRIFGRHV